MCGIWGYICSRDNEITHDKLIRLFDSFMKTKSRGPDFSNFQNYNNVLVGFHRLAIMDLSFMSNQPYILSDEYQDKTIVFVCNGEIYNYKELIETYDLNIKNKSDCLTIPELYLKLGYQKFLKLFNKTIKGEFAFLLFEFDKNNNLTNLIAGRDMIGIRPLYYSNTIKEIIFSSEVKSCDTMIVNEFPPGSIINFRFNENYECVERNEYIYKDVYNTITIYKLEESYLENIRNTVMSCVERRLDSDQPIAFLLSGGVDSSLVAALGAKLCNKKIRTFCCGMNYGSDLKYAKMVADYIGSDHTEVLFTPETALEAINNVIYTIETWDTTTIRASVGQYLVSKYISENTDAKVLFVGEGPDEVCSSYLFNWYSPDSSLIHSTALEYVNEIHYFDVKRADRCIARWGLEARVALLDPEFIKSYWEIPSEQRDPKYKGIEKWWLRKAFEKDNILPSEVLWRKKEAFSDGISSTEKSWFEIIQEYIKEKYNMEEKDYFKQKFVEYFGENRLDIIPHYWQPKWDKDGNEITTYVDPSARTLDIYKN
jgi:asparagine synthase (glutamine-hydrolysing)